MVLLVAATDQIYLKVLLKIYQLRGWLLKWILEVQDFDCKVVREKD